MSRRAVVEEAIRKFMGGLLAAAAFLAMTTLAGAQEIRARPASEAATDSARGMLAGIVRDPTGQPVRDARITISGVTGEWHTGADGAFIVRRVPVGNRVVEIRALGDLPERKVVEFAAKDSAYLDVSMTRAVTTLSTVTVRAREPFNEIKSELDQRRRAGFGYRADSLEIARLPSLAEVFNFPGVRFGRVGARWSIAMTGVYSLTARGQTGASLGCSPTIWLDGTISNIEMLNALTKEEVALVEVYNSAARAPLQYGGTRTNCGVVLVWRKRYIDP